MTTPHSAEGCHDKQCLLPNCVNWKMRNKLMIRTLGTDNHVTNKRNSSCTSMGNGGSRQEAAHGASKDKTAKRRALPKANPKKTRKSPSPHCTSGTLLQPIGQTQSASVGTDDVPATTMNSSMTWSSSNTTTASQVPDPAPKTDSGIGWITLDTTSCTFGTPLSSPPSFDARDFEQLLQYFPLPDVTTASDSSVATTNCGPLLRPSEYPATSQAAGEQPTSMAPWQDNIALGVEATSLAPTYANLSLSPNASEGFTSMSAPIEGGVSDPLMAQMLAHLTSQDGHQAASDPASIPAVLSTSPNIPGSTAQTDTLETTPYETSDSPIRLQYGTTCKTDGQDPSTQFIKTVLNYISRVITMLDEPRSNHLKERFVCILEEAVRKLESSTAWP